MAKSYDVLVAGGGHNGLTVAAYLAKAGLNVRAAVPVIMKDLGMNFNDLIA